ncbi:MAG TPA: hypothetical protein VIH82_08205 [Acidimicrobiia bacterium]
MVATARRNTVLRHPWRWALVAVVLVAVLNLAVIALDESDTSPGGRNLPSAVDSVTPAPGELVRLQDTVGADLRDDLTGVLVLDGTEIPEDQLERVIPLAEVTFRPGPGKDLAKLEPGEHTLVVLYWPQGKARPSRPASYSWSFRAGA